MVFDGTPNSDVARNNQAFIRQRRSDQPHRTGLRTSPSFLFSCPQFIKTLPRAGSNHLEMKCCWNESRLVAPSRTSEDIVSLYETTNKRRNETLPFSFLIEAPWKMTSCCRTRTATAPPTPTTMSGTASLCFMATPPMRAGPPATTAGCRWLSPPAL